MKKTDFDKLVTSIREAGRIRRNEANQTRVTRFATVNAKKARKRQGRRAARRGSV